MTVQRETYRLAVGPLLGRRGSRAPGSRADHRVRGVNPSVSSVRSPWLMPIDHGERLVEASAGYCIRRERAVSAAARRNQLPVLELSAQGTPTARMPVGPVRDGRARHAVGFARCEDPLELTVHVGLAELRLRLAWRVWRHSRAARTASPRSRRKSTSSSHSCGRCSCARQQSTYRRASTPVRGTPM